MRSSRFTGCVSDYWPAAVGLHCPWHFMAIRHFRPRAVLQFFATRNRGREVFKGLGLSA